MIRNRPKKKEFCHRCSIYSVWLLLQNRKSTNIVRRIYWKKAYRYSKDNGHHENTAFGGEIFNIEGKVFSQTGTELFRITIV